MRSLDSNLRQWQDDALKVWEQSNCRGIVEVVTGGGKTRFALAAASRWLRGRDKDAAVAIIVPTTALQDQWYVNITGDLEVNPSEISLWPECQDVNRKFHVMVVNTARSRSELIKDNHSELLLIADECHRYASAENARALHVASTASLGLTATADREFDDGLERVLVPNLGNIIYRYSLADARRDGVVSEFSLSNVRVWFKPDEQEKYDRATRALRVAISQNDDEKVKQVARRRAAIAKNAVSRVTASVALMDGLRGSKVIVFHEDIAMANIIAALLVQRGHRTVVFHSKIAKDMRRDNLRLFRAGQADVLVCCRALDEGIDVPGADCAILVASTSSSRQRVQRLGRVLRTHEGKECARIFTIYVSDQEQERLVSELSFMEDVAAVRWLEVAR